MNLKTPKIVSLALVILSMSILSVKAQTPETKAGPNGIYIFFGNKIPINFQYKLDRKPGESDKWEEIYRTPMHDLNFQTVLGKLLQAGAKLSTFTIPDTLTIDRFIALQKGRLTIDSVYIFNALPAYIEAMGTGFYDVTIAPEKNYDYRISEVDRKGVALKSDIVSAEPFPGTVNFDKPEFKNYAVNSRSLVLNFILKGTNTLSNVRVLKQATLQTPFVECYPKKMFSRSNEGIEVMLIDSMILEGVSYRYLLVAVDVLGNPGTLSDTVRVNLNGETIAPLESFEAKEENGFIELKWRANNGSHVQSISIFRSENFDDGYKLLSRVPIADTSFTDRQIQKGISYFYYLVFQGLYSESAPSAKVIGLIDEKDKPVLAPGSVKVTKTNEGNLVEWKSAEIGTKGYYVYRGEGYTKTEYQISDLVVSDSTKVTFVDSISNLMPGQTYCYAVSAVNKGNLEGPLSNVVISTPVKPELPTPTNLVVKIYNDNAMLFWDNISSMSNYITGYEVFRTESEVSQFEAIGRANASTYYDSTVIRGVNYSYSIKTLGIEDSKSSLSASAEFLLPEILPVPPSGLRATTTPDSVIIHWDAPAVTDLANFKIYREKLGEEKKLIATVNQNTNDFADILSDEGSYFYTVTTITNKGLESKPSDEVGAKK
ncbi:MAG: hypothetical protein PF436_08955 [Prolixibacteraceae bacterium]|jgi:fibronectin type 3 domain-containing protein|nr:hypothetical protein [Prolixibacteraceae bacterium]